MLPAKLINLPITAPLRSLPAVLSTSAWDTATEAQRGVARARQSLIERVVQDVKKGASINNAAALLVSRIQSSRLVLAEKTALEHLGEVSHSTIKRWISDYLKQGRNGLLPSHTGRVRQDYGWEIQAAQLFNIPSNPGYAGVAKQLQAQGFDSATESRVKRFIKSLPATMGFNSPARVGVHLHKLRRQGYRPRHTDDLRVGEIYAGDGHTCDCYVAHPATGKPYRPELTAFIDIASRYVPGFYISDVESATSTLFALGNAVRCYDHVPGWLYLDRGSGYRAKALADDNTGVYARWGIQVIGALPGNPHGKGWIERWFRTVRDDHDKFFAGGMVYCGDDMAPEINRRMSAEIDAGRRILPSYAEYVESLHRFINLYNHRPLEVLGGLRPAQVWRSLHRNEPVLNVETFMRLVKVRKVRRQMVELDNRKYYHQALALYDGHEVKIEYDITNDAQVWITDKDGRHICTAELVQRKSVLTESRIEDGRQQQLQEKLKRLEKKADEARARSRDVITLDSQVAQLESMEVSALITTADEINLLEF